jgi:FMN phosphatase YigB (HAD superfamily)
MSSSTLKALLLDLDGTLIDNAMDTFLPAYIRALGEFAASMVDPGRFTEELLNATRVMDGNDGSGPSNEKAFASAFYPALGVAREELEPLLERFYDEVFPQLESLTRPRPEAPWIIEWATGRGLQVVIATNPLFPRTAIEQRMAWGGVGVDRFDYARVTTYENSRATKSSPAYFSEIVDHIGRRPQECLMVGDHWGWDVVCAGEAGIPSYWISNDGAEPPEPVAHVIGRGNLSAFQRAAEDGSLETRFQEHVERGLAV